MGRESDSQRALSDLADQQAAHFRKQAFRCACIFARFCAVLYYGWLYAQVDFRARAQDRRSATRSRSRYLVHARKRVVAAVTDILALDVATRTGWARGEIGKTPQ